MDGYTVGEVARLAGVSVRTLHHYDEIGLVTPRQRSAAGYRLYADDDLRRLQQVLFYRELDFGLDEIAQVLAESGTTVEDHLRRQHRLLRERIARGRQLLDAIEKEMEARQMGMSLTPEEQFEVFGTDKVGGEWAEEARQRWGDTDAFRESQARTTRYTKQDWQRLKAEADDGLRAFADAMRSGASPASTAAMDLAEAHRRHISTWFYECSHDTHRGLAQMYIGDERFRATYEAVAPGLAQFVHDAIVANAERAGAQDG